MTATDKNNPLSINKHGVIVYDLKNMIMGKLYPITVEGVHHYVERISEKKVRIYRKIRK